MAWFTNESWQHKKTWNKELLLFFFLNLSKYRFFFQLIQVVTVMESRCLTASIFFHRFFFGPFFLGLPGPCPMAKLNDKSKVWRWGDGPRARRDGPKPRVVRLNFGVRPCQPKKNGWNFPKLVDLLDVEMFCCFFLGFLFGAFFFLLRFHDSFLGSVSLIHSECWSETSHPVVYRVNIPGKSRKSVTRQPIKNTDLWRLNLNHLSAMFWLPKVEAPNQAC